MRTIPLQRAHQIGTSVAFFFLWLLGLGFFDPAAAAEKVRFAVPVIAVQYAPIFLGIREGLFAREGLEIEIHVMRTDMALTALNVGQLDYIAHGGAALRGAVRGFPIKLIYALDDKAAFWLLATPEIQRPEMLKGKIVGVSFPGDTPHLVLKRYLRRRGLDPEKDVTYVAGQFSPIGFQGLVAGVLDAAVMAPPYTVLAEEKGFRALAFLGDEVPDAPTINGIVTSEKKLQSQTGQARRLVRATLKSVQLYRRNKEMAISFLASEFNLDKSTAKKVYGNAVEMLLPNGQVSLDKVRDVLNLGKEAGQNNLPLQSPESILDLSLVKEAQGEIGKRP